MCVLAQAVATPAPSLRRLVRITALSWFAIVSLDFFLNAGLLARFYHWNLPGFLPPLKMFQFIPLGYAGFLLWSILLVWLMRRLSISGFHAGAVFGLKVGTLVAAAGLCGQLSIFTFPTQMLLIWMVVNTLSFTVGGAVAGAGLAAPHLRRLVLGVVALFIVCLVGGLVLQSLGPSPAVKMMPGRVGIGWSEK